MVTVITASLIPQINSVAAFEQRAHRLLEQLEVGSEENYSAIIRQSSK